MDIPILTWLNSKFKIVSHVYNNDYAIVCKACETTSKNPVYLKTFETSNESRYNHLQKSLALSQSLSRETHVLPILEKFLDDKDNHLAYSLPQGTPLSQYLNENCGLGDIQILKIVHSLATTLAYVKKNYRVFHGDLKPSNIIEYNQEFKISDWEIGALLAHSGELALKALSFHDMLYVAPEKMFRHDNSVQIDFFKADVYSLGLIFLRILGASSHRLRELRDCPLEYYEQVKESVIGEYCSTSVKLSSHMSQLLHSMLMYDPESRLDMEKVEETVSEIASRYLMAVLQCEKPIVKEEVEEQQQQNGSKMLETEGATSLPQEEEQEEEKKETEPVLQKKLSQQEDSKSEKSDDLKNFVISEIEAAIKQNQDPKKLEDEEIKRLQDYSVCLEEQAEEMIANDHLEEALEYYNKALHAIELYLPPNDLYLAKLLEKIGRVYYESEQYEEAYAKHLKCYQIRVEKLGSEQNELVSDSLNELGLVLHLQGKIDEALQNLQKSLHIRQQLLGGFSTKVADSYNNIGNAYFDQGQLDKAYDSHVKCYDIYHQSLDSDDLRIALSLNNIGRVLEEQEKYEASINSYLKSLKIYTGSGREEDFDVADCYENIGRVHQKQGNFKEAQENYSRSLKIKRKVCGPTDARVGHCLTALGGILLADGDGERALQIFEEALGIMRKCYGEMNVQTAFCYGYLGDVFAELEAYQHSEDNYAEAIKILTELGNTDPQCKENLIEIMMQLSRMLIKQGDNVKASSALQQAMNLAKVICDPESPHFNNIKELLEEIAQMQSKSTEEL